MRIRYETVMFAALMLVLGAAVSSANTGFSCSIDQSQEVPASGSPAIGSGSFVLNSTSTDLHYDVLYSGLVATRTASHFHGPAAPGVNAPVVFGIAGVGLQADDIIGDWSGPSLNSNLLNLQNSLLYINIHSLTFPGGEIRGQIHPDQAVPSHASSWGRIKQLYR